MLHYFWAGGRNEEKASGRQKVNRSESISGQHLSFSSASSLSLSLPAPFFHGSRCLSRSCSHFRLLHDTTEFNQQLEMTAGTDGRARSIVLVCEAGAQGGNETQKERWGVGTGDYDR